MSGYDEASRSALVELCKVRIIRHTGTRAELIERLEYWHNTARGPVVSHLALLHVLTDHMIGHNYGKRVLGRDAHWLICQAAMLALQATAGRNPEHDALMLEMVREAMKVAHDPGRLGEVETYLAGLSDVVA